MVIITKQNDNFIFELKGMHKLWAFKSSITIPTRHIISVEKYNDNFSLGLRIPGTHLPGVIMAGSYYGCNNAIFCDVCNKEKSIIVHLKDEHYNKLIIEVDNVEEAIKILSQEV